MKTDTRQKIFDFIEQNKPIKASDVQRHFGLSRGMVHRHLKKLIEEKLIEKRGTPPQVFYFTTSPSATLDIEMVNGALVKDFLYILPDGKRMDGVMGFMSWCADRCFNAKEKAQDDPGRGPATLHGQSGAGRPGS